MAMGDDLQKYTYAYLMKKALAAVSDNNVDKREGSVTYDTAALASYLLAEGYQNLYNLVLETYAKTASGEWLEARTIEMGITRYQASKCVKLGTFTTTNTAGETVPYAAPIGSKWASIDTEESYTYVVTKQHTNVETGFLVEGAYELEAETAGVAPQRYTGAITPLSYMPAAVTATLGDTLTPGRDLETDESLYNRYVDRLNYKSFGGNIAQYREWTLAIDGVGGVQVYPVWNGGGTVKVSIIDSDYRACTADFVAEVQNELDPTNAQQGTGLGTAPIDHWVTVVTADETPINVEATIEIIDSSKELDWFVEQAKILIEEYLLTVRQDWGKNNALNTHELYVYPAQIMVKLLTIEGLGSITDLKINGSEQYISMTEDATTQQLPVLGTVTLNEFDNSATS